MILATSVELDDRRLKSLAPRLARISQMHRRTATIRMHAVASSGSTGSEDSIGVLPQLTGFSPVTDGADQREKMHPVLKNFLCNR